MTVLCSSTNSEGRRCCRVLGHPSNHLSISGGSVVVWGDLNRKDRK